MTAGKKKRAAKKARAPVAPAPVSVSRVLDECIAGISMIEVSVRSLEENDGAATERVTLKRAVKALWVVHDYLSDVPGADEGGEDDG